MKTKQTAKNLISKKQTRAARTYLAKMKQKTSERF
jgi:hypothetical protein